MNAYFRNECVCWDGFLLPERAISIVFRKRGMQKLPNPSTSGFAGFGDLVRILKLQLPRSSNLKCSICRIFEVVSVLSRSIALLQKSRAQC